jgi:hypothetical protein
METAEEKKELKEHIRKHTHDTVKYLRKIDSLKLRKY